MGCPPVGLAVAVISVWLTLYLMRRRNLGGKGSRGDMSDESLVSELSPEELERYSALFERNVMARESETKTGNEDQ